MAKYKRDAATALSYLFENASGQVLTKKNCKIQIPVRFTEVGLGEIGINTFSYGFFPIIFDSDEYAVLSVCAMVELNPYKLTTVSIDDDDYYEFYFDAGQVVFKATDLVKKETLMYNVFDEFIFKGKLPWYAEYEDVGKLFDTALYHAGSKVARNLEVIEFVASMISRSKADRTKYIRTLAESYNDVRLEKVDFVPLKSVFYSVSSTLNKIAGSYFTDGVTSALVQQSDNVEKIERIIRR
jgi:hypothetical protein